MLCVHAVPLNVQSVFTGAILFDPHDNLESKTGTVFTIPWRRALKLREGYESCPRSQLCKTAGGVLGPTSPEAFCNC